MKLVLTTRMMGMMISYKCFYTERSDFVKMILNAFQMCLLYNTWILRGKGGGGGGGGGGGVRGGSAVVS